MIDIPSPNKFYVISAKDEHGRTVFLQKIESIFVESWTTTIQEFTYRYDTRKEARDIMNIQCEHFPERNRNLAAFKVKEIKPILVIK